MKIIYIVVKDKEEAKKIGKFLIEERLAACINYFPINSIYRWEGKIEKGGEVGMLVKTREDLVEKVIEKVKERHSYKVPCVVCLKVEQGNKDFLEWIKKETERE